METLNSFEPLFSIHLHANFCILDDENIFLEFDWKDMQGQIVFPQEPAAGRHHELWKQTCFELFLRPKVGIGYFEVNISTTGAWNIYQFQSYRNPQPPSEATNATATEILSEREKLSAKIRIPDVDLSLVDASLCAIILLKNGKTSYWSTRHTGHKPDFHHPDSLILERKSPMSFEFGLEALLKNKKLMAELKKKRVSLVCHPASVDQKLNHSFDILTTKIKLTSAFGPQHGVKGEKQDNMVESADELHPDFKIPIFSLYGKVRRPTKEMMETFDVLLFDLQDLGCRIYTFVTTLLYVMEECAKYNKTLIVLDRPNPAGREIEGFRLQPGQESFVGAGPFPMRHGLTVGELALYFKDHYKLKMDLRIVKMKGYKIEKKPNFGWPDHVTWINPSPNAPNLNMARAYSGTVMLEGTTLSEGRGTTRSLEIAGAPDLDMKKIFKRMQSISKDWMKGAILRECHFEPTFHKHQGKTCHGFQIHTDHPSYSPKKFKPYRLFALFFKAIRLEYPKYHLYRDFHYEYVTDRLAFDVINGGPELRDWIETPTASAADLDRKLIPEEKSWAKESKKYHLY